MPELTREEKLKLFEKLSPRLQELMTSEDTGAALLYLGQKYNLSDDKVLIISKILGDVILGIIPTANSSSEIATKLTIDMQTAGRLVQDLNDLILSPKPTTSTAMPSVPAPIQAPSPKPQMPSYNNYRESITPPEIIDLRKTPPPPMPMPTMPAPTPPKPLTFTRPIEPPRPMPLIEAEPHKIAPPSTDTYREPVEQPATPVAAPIPTKVEPPPQYIMRPPGLPPTDYPRDVNN